MKRIFTIIAMGVAVAASSQSKNTFVYNTKSAEVILLSEGQRSSGLGNLIDLTPEIIAEVAPDNTFPGATNAFLVKTGGKVVLVDTGLGRELFKNLQEHGVEPAGVDAVLITHLHGDHTGGLAKDGARTFPAAKLYLSKKEYESAGENALKIINLYSNDLVIFDPGVEKPAKVYGKIESMACYGHTLGHTAYIIDDLVIWGDLTHAMSIQMPYPKVAIKYDTNPEMAVESRLKMLDYIVKHKLKAAGMHVPYPGIGNVKTNDKGGFVFEPVYFK